MSYWIVVAALTACVATASVSEMTVFKNLTRFKYVHMTMIEQVADDVFLFAFQASKIGEGHADQRIVLTRSFDGGQTWDEARDIITGDGVPVWGPCLFYLPRQNLTLLFFAKGVPQNVRTGGRHFPGGDIYVTNSSDRGLTWTVPQLLLPYDSPTRGNVSKMTANKPVFLTKDQRQWSLPFWQEAHPTNHNDTGPLCAGVLTTQDGGVSYQPHGFIEKNDTWLIENTVVPLSSLPESDAVGGNLTLLQYFRVKKPVLYIHSSVSHDGGITWSPATPINIENPDSKTSAAARIVNATPTTILFAMNPSLTLRRELLVARRSMDAVPLPANLTYGPNIVLGDTSHYNTTHDTWSYPTVLAVEPHERHRWAVSFTGWGTKGAKLAWIRSD